ncbi:MAG TPA: hypothetical protein VF930_08530 [Stellaceae bacterium]
MDEPLNIMLRQITFEPSWTPEARHAKGSTMRERSQLLLGLQALRALAALLVVAHHTAGTLARAKYGGHVLAGGILFPLGRAGVDLFLS